MIGDAVAVEVREDRGIVLAVGSPHKAPAGLHANSGQPHHACYPLVIDDEGGTPEFMCHMSVAVAGQFILDVFDDRRQLGI